LIQVGAGIVQITDDGLKLSDLVVEFLALDQATSEVLLDLEGAVIVRSDRYAAEACHFC